MVSATATEIACSGGTSTVSISATGGTAPYTGTGNFTVVAGMHTYIIDDANGCSTTTTVNVTEPSALIASSSSNTILCYGGSTTVSVSATGGTAPYVGTGDFTVGAGTYSYLVTDDKGCSTSTSITVTEPSEMQVTSAATAITCNGGLSTVSVSATGGTLPYSGTGNFSVTAGSYTYPVTDGNGCSASTTITITEPTVIEASSSSTAILCYGGSATVSVSGNGGTAPYTGTGDYTVNAGTYSYSVTDANGCSSSTSITVTEPSELVVSSSANPILCNGGSSTVSVSATGGTAPYSGTGSFSATAGTYSYIVTDANGCSVTTSGTITEPASPLTATATGSIICYGQSTPVNVIASGGTAPYSGTGIVANVTAGTYSYIVVDANGCTVNADITLTDPLEIIAAISTVDATCDLNNGSATVVPSNGVGPYTYLWTPGGQTSATAVSLLAGNYSVLITDNNGCTQSASATLTTSGTIPATPGTISGPSGACRNQTGVVFSITPIAGATSYIWTLPGGVSGSSTSSSITLSFSSIFSGGTLSVVAVNSCGNSLPSSTSLSRYTSAPSTPGAITGATHICGTQTGTYSVPPVANATSYTWSVVAVGGGTNAIISSGQGTNTVNITYPAGYVAALISVRATNCIGSSGFRLTYALGALIIPPIYTFSNNQTTGVCAGTTKAYEIYKLPNATSYKWTAPLGALISDGFGLTGNPLTVDSSISKVYITFPAGFISGNVSIQASNACGNTSATTLNVSSVPAVPGSISGPTTNLCRKTGQVYSVSSVANATSYTWTVPSGATISGSSTGRSITVNFGTGFTGTGIISVTANNACGSSAASLLSVNSAPATPGNISGSTSVCKSKTNGSYSISSVTGATSYTWSITGGATFVGSTSGTSVTVRFTTSTSSTVTISVRANNSCGGSTTRSLAVNVNFSCRTTNQTEEEEIAEELFSVYPNPVASNLNVEFEGSIGEKYSMRLVDMYGKTVMLEIITSTDGLNRTALDITQYANGVYLLLLEKEGEAVKVQRVVVEKN